jgi:hypothetical protein
MAHLQGIINTSMFQRAKDFSEEDIRKNPMLRPLSDNYFFGSTKTRVQPKNINTGFETEQSCKSCGPRGPCDSCASRESRGRGFGGSRKSSNRMSTAVLLCKGCNDDECTVSLCHNGEKCSRHRRVQKYLLDKHSPVSTEDMKHCEKFVHVQHSECGEWCCGKRCQICCQDCGSRDCGGNGECGMYLGMGIPPCGFDDCYDDDCDDDSDYGH